MNQEFITWQSTLEMKAKIRTSGQTKAKGVYHHKAALQEILKGAFQAEMKGH